MSPQVFIFALLLPTALGKPLMATNKLSLATWGSYFEQDHKGPGTYAFGYDIEDPVTGNVQFKQEERHPDGTVTGNYGYVDAHGRPHVLTYVSGSRGYRAKLEIEGEPTMYFPDASSFEEAAFFGAPGLGAQKEAPGEALRGPSVEGHPPAGRVGARAVSK